MGEAAVINKRGRNEVEWGAESESQIGKAYIDARGKTIPERKTSTVIPYEHDFTYFKEHVYGRWEIKNHL